ncbi:phosphoribosyl-AMP cyclohydrolase [Leptospira ellinghausenii]|uniref:phosphoribosyl-AMP cyclohydrolase n=1 Tax=Leptospira ellinghausenii TaxID=1917822 RepID=A0A2P2DG33_9LEPT|nr:phosphoribosyl-AMP cyclohydrolase [Leptospira ellinghausenii]GBF43587.1 phosphoribosyl-AMP cyclohydrolase [Leptospira ellinghausenii]
MIQIPSDKDIVILTKPNFLSHDVSVKVLNTKQTVSMIQDFDFEKNKLFVDCDEDCFLEIVPSLKLSTKRLLWEDGKLLVSQIELDTLLNSMPLLSPFLAQDMAGKDLMLAWGKKESLLSAIESGFGTYFSRSRNGKWVKGEESGHLQNLKQIYLHTNPVFVQYVADQVGAACHTGYYSCFFRELGQNDTVSFVYSNKVGE